MSISDKQEYEVIVITRVRETYSVMASSADEALKNWTDGDLVSSECESIEDEIVGGVFDVDQ